MKRLSLLTLVLALCACAPPKTPTAPVVPIPIATRAVWVRTAANAGIQSCSVTFTVPDKGQTANTNADGYVAFDVPIDPKPGGLNVQMAATCPGAQPWAWSYVMAAAGNQDIYIGGSGVSGNQPVQAPGLVSSAVHVDPMSLSLAQLADIQTDFSGVRVPSIVPACPVDPVTNIQCVGDTGQTPAGLMQGLAYTENLRIYTPVQQGSILDVIAAHRYTHVLIGVTCDPANGRGYHGIYPPLGCDAASGAGLNASLQLIYDHHLIPVCQALNDGNPPDASYPAGFDTSLCRIVMGPFEHPWADCQLSMLHASFPNALLFWEPNYDLGGDWTPVADGCSPNPMPRSNDWVRYAMQAYNLSGVFVETNGSLDLGAATAQLTAMLPVFRDVAEVLMETTAYPSFWTGTSEADAVAFNDGLRQQFPVLRSFVNSGTPHDPPASAPTQAGAIDAHGADMIDASQASVFNSPGDLLAWPVTSPISAIAWDASGASVSFSKRDGAGRWPDVAFGSDGSLEYTLGMCLNISSHWNCSAAIQFWSGLPSSGGPPTSQQLIDNWFTDSNRWGPMAGYRVAPGELVGVFVAAGNDRGAGAQLVQERSNIVLVPWPADGSSINVSVTTGAPVAPSPKKAA